MPPNMLGFPLRQQVIYSFLKSHVFKVDFTTVFQFCLVDLYERTEKNVISFHL